MFELGGPDVFTYREFYTLIAELMNKKRVLVPVPMLIIKPIVRIGEKAPFFPLNLEQLSLFNSDNILNNDIKGFDYVKILPRKVISAIKKSI